MNSVKSRSVNVNLPPDIAEGVYSNICFVSHSPAEFIVDFARMLPGLQQPKVFSRVVLTPQAAKQLTKMLEKSIKGYEDRFGEIKFVQQNAKDPVGFRMDNDVVEEEN